MAKFLTGDELNSEIAKIFKNAEEQLSNFLSHTRGKVSDIYLK